jgi:hypothetical protein
VRFRLDLNGNFAKDYTGKQNHAAEQLPRHARRTAQDHDRPVAESRGDAESGRHPDAAAKSRARPAHPHWCRSGLSRRHVAVLHQQRVDATPPDRRPEKRRDHEVGPNVALRLQQHRRIRSDADPDRASSVHYRVSDDGVVHARPIHRPVGRIDRGRTCQHSSHHAVCRHPMAGKRLAADIRGPGSLRQRPLPHV